MKYAGRLEYSRSTAGCWFTVSVLLVSVIAFGACAGSRAPTAVTKIVHSQPICRGMEKFEARHVDAFFAKAKPIGTAEAHRMDVLPCEVHGRTLLGGAAVTFVIRPLGFADVTDAAGVTTLYGCDDCTELFPPH